MKKHTEKPPIDDLFARKLGGASLRPSPDGFERLQARMKPNQPRAQLVVWKNPVAQRYMAAAACLLVVAGFGWLYWPSDSDNNPMANGTQIADNQRSVGPRSVGPRSVGPRSVGPRTTTKQAGKSELKTPTEAPESALTGPTLANASTVDQSAPASSGVERNREVVTQTERATNNVKIERPTLPATLPNETIAQLDKPQADKPTPGSTGVTPSTNPPARPVPANAAVADASTRNLPAERVLVVTIAEPEALVAARRAAQPTDVDQPVPAASDKPQKETKAGNLWQQLKRVKQGEVFARRDGSDDESGLLSRAYNGLKHNFDKEKSAKQ